MEQQPSPKTKITLSQAFRCAGSGVIGCVRTQRNMKIHVAAAVAVVVAGLLCRLAPLEWCAVALCIGAVCALECVNTAVEAAVDLVTEEYHPLAKVAKDCAAGAVLVAAAASVAVGMLVFVPAICRLLGQ
ncbi:diacylglycerol kinase family protein [Parvibacter caecicola]|mgnify:CR=1 FL=1|uniref:Diacylglycerol kinase family protein n=1 Tax=Parvibacter caecicola TaxID=747645 RepID=A0A4T9T975_9ACTN|nr:diacylglycerol kinase family protein [Parvibacter caecicola]TJW12109.1 diacylglycerol kinase family protein [Parvibacter caecicola]